MSKKCDNLSVGIFIKNKEHKILLIERKKSPFGFAAPSGHIDDFASPEECARGETQEEVGLIVDSLDLLYEGRKDNPCRREGGTHHYWYVYGATVHGEMIRSMDETKQAGWHSHEQIKQLAQRTKLYIQRDISEAAWERSPGIEPVWYKLFADIGVL